MRNLFSVLAVGLLSGPVFAQSPTEYYSKTNPPPQDPKIAVLEARLDKLEAKSVAQDSKLDAILAAVSKPAPVQVAKAPVPVQPVQQVTSGVRAPVGHTHTCANGHSWDHTMDGGSHLCPFCGLPQTIQDRTPRMVAPVAPAVTSPATPSYHLCQSYSLGASGGCANGSCQSGSSYSPTSGWYLGKRLGR